MKFQKNISVFIDHLFSELTIKSEMKKIIKITSLNFLTPAINI